MEQQDLYPMLSLHMRKEMTESSLKCMTMIGQLDRAAQRLSKQLNRRLRSLNMDEVVTTLDSTSHLDENEELDEEQSEQLRRRKALLQELEDIDNLRKIMEVLSAKKLELAIKNYDFVDLNVKTIDAEIGLLEKAIRDGGQDLSPNQQFGPAAETDTAGTARTSESNGDNQDSSAAVSINEPIYCICKRVAFGEMIACDNEDCPVEWFHYPCVNLTRKPRNSWVCHLCSSKKKKT